MPHRDGGRPQDDDDDLGPFRGLAVGCLLSLLILALLFAVIFLLFGGIKS